MLKSLKDLFIFLKRQHWFVSCTAPGSKLRCLDVLDKCCPGNQPVLKLNSQYVEEELDCL